MTTYLEVAEKIIKDNKTKAKYVSYMMFRWPKTETQKCQDGYAEEWAYRFADGREYECSDAEGRAVLMEIEA